MTEYDEIIEKLKNRQDEKEQAFIMGSVCGIALGFICCLIFVGLR